MSTTTGKSGGNDWWPKCRQWLARRRNDWIRAVFMLLFLLVLYLVLTVIMPILALIQLVSSLVAGKVNGSLCEAGAHLADYAKDVIRFVSYRTDVKPWPFAPAKSSSSGRSSATSSSHQ